MWWESPFKGRGLRLESLRKAKTLSPTKLRRCPSKVKILNHCLNHAWYVQPSLKVHKQQRTAGYKHVNILVEILLQLSTEVSVWTKGMWTHLPGKNAEWLETGMIPRVHFLVQCDDLLRVFDDRYPLFASLAVGRSGYINSKHANPADPCTSCLPSWKMATGLKNVPINANKFQRQYD